MEIKNSNDRFEEALLLPERPETKRKNHLTKSENITTIKFDNYSAVYAGQENPSLENLNFEISTGSLLGVIGLFKYSINIMSICIL